MLRDYLISDINDEAVQHCLLAEPSLDLKRALELAKVWRQLLRMPERCED